MSQKAGRSEECANLRFASQLLLAVCLVRKWKGLACKTWKSLSFKNSLLHLLHPVRLASFSVKCCIIVLLSPQWRTLTKVLTRWRALHVAPDQQPSTRKRMTKKTMFRVLIRNTTG